MTIKYCPEFGLIIIFIPNFNMYQGDWSNWSELATTQGMDFCCFNTDGCISLTIPALAY